MNFDRGNRGSPTAVIDETAIFEAPDDGFDDARSALELELAGARQLQKISTRLIQEEDLSSLYREIVLAAMAIMRSDFGSMQTYHPDRNALYLLVSENFHPDAAKYFEWVSCGEATACGMVLEAGDRVIVPDMEACEFMAGTEELEYQRKCGMRAVQSTPLFSRNGQPIGMISTHWRQPHQPSENDWRLFDVLARQAADLIERTNAEERRKLLVNELNHRVKNTLAIVQSIAHQTLRGKGVPLDVSEEFSERLTALAAAHGLLTETQWESVDIAEVVRRTLEACYALDRVEIGGPSLRLTSGTAVTLAMGLHELCTNAIKYGSLSVAKGLVRIEWIISDDAQPRFHLRWQESGGPPVRQPERKGFGSRLIERVLAAEFKGKAILRYEPEGVIFELDTPVPASSGTLGVIA